MVSIIQKSEQFANILNGGSDFDQKVNQAQNSSYAQSGFTLPPTPSADRSGLPSSKIPAGLKAQNVRNIVHFFVPQVGVVNMYINPQNIQYRFDKVIDQQRTKGGYILQYWGEELPTLTISGHTGSSGVEGLNVLYEVYRAEQYTFDSIGLTVASAASISGLGDLVSNVFGNTVGEATGGLFGLNPVTQNVLPRNIPTLGSLAFGVEIFYSGWVFRGYFKDFQFTEAADKLGLFDYIMNFVVTQKRGYRTNYLPWHRSATQGPSNNDPNGTGPELTFDGRLTY